MADSGADELRALADRLNDEAKRWRLQVTNDWPDTAKAVLRAAIGTIVEDAKALRSAADREEAAWAAFDEAAGFLLRLHTQALDDHLDMGALMDLALDVGEWANDPACIRLQLDRLARARALLGSTEGTTPDE